MNSYILNKIKSLSLNLENCNVYTEGASGAYLLNPIVAALAGAREVYCQINDSRF